MRKMVAVLGTLALAACGVRAPLEPAPGQSAPIAPLAESQPPTSEQLLARPPQARPERVDELLTESEDRRDDRFDLPPD